MKNGLPSAESLKKVYAKVNELIKSGHVLSAYTPTYGGIAEAVLKMSLGNRIGFEFDEKFAMDEAFAYKYGSFILELSETAPDLGTPVGKTTEEYTIVFADERVDGMEISEAYESVLESVYPSKTGEKETVVPAIAYMAKERVAPSIGVARPKVLIPVFPGTNCEYDTADALRRAGAEPVISVIKNLTANDVEESVERIAKLIDDSQIIFIPGGFSGGDEPEGSAKLIAAFFRNPRITESVNSLLDKRDGLMCGICNGFQALIKLGLVPFGQIVEGESTNPTLTFNTIGRHQSRLVRTRVASNKSPWLMHCDVGDIFTEPISHGEGRFVCEVTLLKKLCENGQVATQYVDISGTPSLDIEINPNGSVLAIEGITSPDGRVFGKMAHSERKGDNLYKNVDGNKESKIFKGAVDYFKI